MILQFLPFSKIQQFHNCVAALTNTAVYFLSLNSKTTIAFSLKTFIDKDTFYFQSYLCKLSDSLNQFVLQNELFSSQTPLR